MLTIAIAFLLLAAGAEPACADPITGAIVAFFGLSGAAATIGTAALDIGLGLAVSYGAQKISGKGKQGTGARGSNLSMTISTDQDREIILGEYGNAGGLAYWQMEGNQNQVARMIVPVADFICDGLVTSAITVDGVQRTVDANGYISGFSNKLRITFHNGDPTQAADAATIAGSGGRWTANDVGKYVAYAVIEATYDPKAFPSGSLPQIVFRVRGAKLYDWRKDDTAGGVGPQRWADQSTWAYSDNPIVALYNVQRGIKQGGVPLIGMGVPAAALRLDDFTAAANACDELMPLAAGGTEKRYRIGCVINTSMTNREIIELILSSCAGELIEACGIYRPMVGVARASVATLTDRDIVITEPLNTDPKRPRSELVNAVYGSYSDPTRGFNSVPLPNRTSSDDEAADGGRRYPTTLELTAVTSRSQAQRIMEITRKRARRQLRVSATFRARWCILEAGDWITLNSDRRGYVDRAFEIATYDSAARDLKTSLTLQEVDAGIDDWTTADELPDNQATDLASGGPSLTTVSGLTVTPIVVAGAGGAQVPALAIAYDVIDDPTIVSLALEYRKIGDTVAIAETILDPEGGPDNIYAAWKGIQGNVEYEARLRPVTQPVRGTDWTPWTPSAQTDPQIVDFAALAGAVPPNTITPDMLSAQARLELENATALASIQGSVNDRLNKVMEMVSQAAAAAASAAATNQLLYRAVKAQANGNSIQVTETLGAIATLQNGLEAQWTVAIDLNGNVKGIVQLFSDEEASIFTVLADRIVFALPDGTGARQVITVGILPDGSTGVGIDAESVIFKGTIKAEHIDVVSLSTLTITDPDDVWELRLSQGWWGAKDNSRYIDMKNGVIDWALGA